MSQLVFYILILAVAIVRAVLEAKKKEIKQQPTIPTNADATPLPHKEFAEEPDIEIADEPYMQPQNVAEPLFEEGSDRILHSSQMASDTTQKQKHDAHPLYDELNTTTAESEPLQLTPNDMRQALIYKTILDRIEY